MKRMNFCAFGLGFCLLLSCMRAEAGPGSTNIADRVGRVILPDHVQFDSPGSLAANTRPSRPDLRPELAPEIKSRIVRFEKFRETYLARQQELLRKLNGAASDEERARVRAQLQGLRDEWLEKARAFKEDARARMRELQSEFPKYREALMDAKEGALDSVNPARKRRGDE